MPLKLETPTKTQTCVVVNPYPIFITAKGPGPPEQVFAFRPYEFDDPDYKCLRLMQEHTADRMVRRNSNRLVKLTEDKGWQFSDRIDELREKHPDWENRDIFEQAWTDVLKQPVPKADNSSADQLVEVQANNRLDELHIPSYIYANPENPWPSWWKLMVVEDPALAWEDWRDYAEGETPNIQPEESAVRAREARQREAARKQSAAAKSEKEQALKEKARKARAAAQRRSESPTPAPKPVASVLEGLDEAMGGGED